MFEDLDGRGDVMIRSEYSWRVQFVPHGFQGRRVDIDLPLFLPLFPVHYSEPHR